MICRAAGCRKLAEFFLVRMPDIGLCPKHYCSAERVGFEFLVNRDLWVSERWFVMANVDTRRKNLGKKDQEQLA